MRCRATATQTVSTADNNTQHWQPKTDNRQPTIDDQTTHHTPHTTHHTPHTPTNGQASNAHRPPTAGDQHQQHNGPCVDGQHEIRHDGPLWRQFPRDLGSQTRGNLRSPRRPCTRRIGTGATPLLYCGLLCGGRTRGSGRALFSTAERKKERLENQWMNMTGD